MEYITSIRIDQKDPEREKIKKDMQEFLNKGKAINYFSPFQRSEIKPEIFHFPPKNETANDE